MCPEPGLISAFVDGEVPSPWKERLAAHLELCPSCAARERAFRGLHEALAVPPPSAVAGAGSGAAEGLDEDAVLARIEARLGSRLAARDGSPATDAVATTRSHRGSGASGLWGRRLTLPLPLAMAAAAALVFLAGLSFAGFLRPHVATPVQTLAATQIAPSAAQPSSMEALFNYLETQDAKVNLTIQLPSGATLDSSGKPMVVRAADANYLPSQGTDGK